MTDPHESRKRAYRYIVEQSRKLNWDLDHRLDKKSVGVDYISLDDLEKLKEGLSGPSQELVSVLRRLFSRVATENEVDDYLVTPFLHKHDFPQT